LGVKLRDVLQIAEKLVRRTRAICKVRISTEFKESPSGIADALGNSDIDFV
jgi:hypothetical protein